jgi:hypothetical protein
MDEAADEIERLRADWPEQLQAHSVLIAEQELEIARLRALLSRTGSDGEKSGDNAAECRDQGVKCPERERVANYPDTPDSSTLTDAEREAVEYFATFDRSPRERDAAAAAALRGLLDRLSPPAT